MTSNQIIIKTILVTVPFCLKLSEARNKTQISKRSLNDFLLKVGAGLASTFFIKL